ncbi:MAG TPA: cupin domain-containing protein [Gaiellaceae bacterium]|nr:cupin domain-containing protein [Gaiellaceae bacterium]
MPDEARLERTENGLVPRDGGWFVVNAADTPWWQSGTFGASTSFEGEGEAAFPELGMNIHVLWPGQPNGLYHQDSAQEDFLVVSGECLVLIEGEERRLKAWDFVHCPGGTDHIFVGAGDGPCVIVMAGSRAPSTILYPVSELADRHGAGAKEETTVPREAYAPFDIGGAGPMPNGALTGAQRS